MSCWFESHPQQSTFFLFFFPCFFISVLWVFFSLLSFFFAFFPFNCIWKKRDHLNRIPEYTPIPRGLLCDSDSMFISSQLYAKAWGTYNISCFASRNKKLGYKNTPVSLFRRFAVLLFGNALVCRQNHHKFKFYQNSKIVGLTWPALFTNLLQLFILFFWILCLCLFPRRRFLCWSANRTSFVKNLGVFLKKLWMCLQLHFPANITLWRKHCNNSSSSKFKITLMHLTCYWQVVARQ